MREPRHPARDELRLTDVLHALSDPARLGVVVDLLAHDEIACAAFDLPFAKATRSHHFRVLREAGLIRVRTQGRAQFACLRADDLHARFPGLIDLLRRSGAEARPSAPDVGGRHLP